MRWAGVGGALIVLPVLAVGGFAVLAVAPTLAVFTIVNALFRAAQQGIAGPAQQTLFTVLDRQDKYKAKSFLDTFGYRAGDAMGAYLERALSLLGFRRFSIGGRGAGGIGCLAGALPVSGSHPSKTRDARPTAGCMMLFQHGSIKR